jgi:hypothetical protein
VARHSGAAGRGHRHQCRGAALLAAMGFTETGEVKPYQYDKLISQSRILTKKL